MFLGKSFFVWKLVHTFAEKFRRKPQKTPAKDTLNFGYERKGDSLILYLHCAIEGRKLDILKKNPPVFFQMDCASELVSGSAERPCAFSWKYESVMGSGKVEFIDNMEKKSFALNKIIRHVGGTDGNLSFPEASLSRTCVLSVQSNAFTGKRHL